MENEAESPQIRVKDRRRFSPDGEPLEEESPTAPGPAPAGTEFAATGISEQPPAESSASETNDAGTAGDVSATATPEPEPPPSFSASGSQQAPTASFELLVLSLAMQAEMELGVHGKPEEQPPNLDLARHSIDMLGVLQEKTNGNLSFEEKRQLDNAVTMLRFRYVQAVQELNQKAKA